MEIDSLLVCALGREDAPGAFVQPLRRLRSMASSHGLAGGALFDGWRVLACLQGGAATLAEALDALARGCSASPTVLVAAPWPATAGWRIGYVDADVIERLLHHVGEGGDVAVAAARISLFERALATAEAQ